MIYTNIPSGLRTNDLGLFKGVLDQGSAIATHRRNIGLDSDFSVKNQVFIPHYAIHPYGSKYIFSTTPGTSGTIDPSYTIESIEYPKHRKYLGNNLSVYRISNSLGMFTKYFENYWYLNNDSSVVELSYSKNNVNYKIYIGGGIVYDENMVPLVALVYKKDLIDRLNTIPGIGKFNELFNLFSVEPGLSTVTNPSNLKEETRMFLRENAILLMNKDFINLDQYKRFYKIVKDRFLNTELGYKLGIDSIVTESIENYIFSLPNGDTSELEFTSLAEKNEFCKKITRDSILTI